MGAAQSGMQPVCPRRCRHVRMRTTAFRILNRHDVDTLAEWGFCMVRWLRRLLLLVLALALLAALALWWLLRGSLPALDGEIALAGLSAPATISRDKLGIVTIDAANEADALRALGYVHAQERYFEMDLMRRTAAGELAELFGAAALPVDRRHRVHRMRARVLDHLDSISGDRQPQ